MVASEKRAIVIGASAGIGAACVRELARRGYRVAAVARSRAPLEALAQEHAAVTPVVHDVRDTGQVPECFRRTVDGMGGLDVVIYAAGVMHRQSDSTYDTPRDLETLEVNLHGCIAWLNEVAPFFVAQERGAIVGISSIAGDRGRVGYPAYNTSKAAMNTYLEALRNRLSRHGVTVSTVKPGYVATAMTAGLEGMFWVAQPEQVATTVVNAAERGHHTRYVLRRWALVGLVIRNIPSFIFRRLRF